MKSKKAKAATKRGVVSAPGCSTCRNCFEGKAFVGSYFGYPQFIDGLFCRRFPQQVAVTADHACGEYAKK